MERKKGAKITSLNAESPTQIKMLSPSTHSNHITPYVSKIFAKLIEKAVNHVFITNKGRFKR